MSQGVDIADIIAPSFYNVHNAIKDNAYTHYWLKGGRGSTKSSFASIEVVLGLMREPGTHAVILRKVATELRGSVFAQILWAIDQLGVNEFWEERLSPLEIRYKPTGQRIVFRGADSPRKIKSLKFASGRVKYVWYEEVDEFLGAEELRVINQSLIRAGDTFTALYSYNPPISQRNWVNSEVLIERSDKLVHHSSYLDVPAEWLGNLFMVEADHLKRVQPQKYAHEYLGEVIGTGGEVFTNIIFETITDEQIQSFDKVNRGLDWGYASDPLHYTVNYYDKTRRRLYIFHEVHKVGMKTTELIKLIKTENTSNQFITADTNDPRANADLRSAGINVQGAKKGKDSVEHGIKWLADLEAIIMDKERCPNTAREFYEYELEPDKNGEFKAQYPDKNNHSIDAARYSLEDYIRQAKEIKAISINY